MYLPECEMENMISASETASGLAAPETASGLAAPETGPRVTAPESALHRLAKLIRSGAPVVFVTGSGISAPSGIPTFRGADNAVWANWVTEWGTREKFLADPREWWNQFWLPAHVVKADGQAGDVPRPRTYNPNPAHEALAAICNAYPKTVVLTQNIDELHQRAGLPMSSLVEVHGRQGLLKCVNAGCRYATTDSFDAPPMRLVCGEAAGSVKLDGELPRCPACQKFAMPQALFFDEFYESHTFYQYRKVRRWLKNAHALAFVGTSHAVSITHEALETAALNGLPCFDINLRQPEMPHALLADVPPLCMQHVLGGCELILPHLAALVGRNSELVEQAAALEYREAVSMIGCTPAKRKKKPRSRGVAKGKDKMSISKTHADALR